MGKFKERLWRDLEREHGSELAQISRPAAGRARYARPRLLAGTTVGLATIGTAIALFLSAASTPAAFAVTGNSDGTVSVVLHRIVGIKGANQKLAALGVRAKFVQVVAGCHAALPPAAVANLRPVPRRKRCVLPGQWPTDAASTSRRHRTRSCADRVKAGRSRARPAAASPSTWVRSPGRAAHPPATAVRSPGTMATDRSAPAPTNRRDWLLRITPCAAKANPAPHPPFAG